MSININEFINEACNNECTGKPDCTCEKCTAAREAAKINDTDEDDDLEEKCFGRKLKKAKNKLKKTVKGKKVKEAFDPDDADMDDEDADEDDDDLEEKSFGKKLKKAKNKLKKKTVKGKKVKEAFDPDDADIDEDDEDTDGSQSFDEDDYTDAGNDETDYFNGYL